MNEKVFLRLFQHIVSLQAKPTGATSSESMKWWKTRNTIAGYESALTSGRRFCGQRR